MATLFAPSSSVGRTFSSPTPAIGFEEKTSSTNWTLTVVAISGGASVEIDSIYLAVWTADTALKVPPKALSTFNETGNLYYSGVKFVDVNGDSILNPGDYFVFDISAYSPGLMMSVLMDYGDNNGVWGLMGYRSVGWVSSTNYGDYEQLPPPPFHINIGWLAAILSGIGCLIIAYLFIKGKVDKKWIGRIFIGIGIILLIIGAILAIYGSIPIIPNSSGWTTHIAYPHQAIGFVFLFVGIIVLSAGRIITDILSKQPSQLSRQKWSKSMKLIVLSLVVAIILICAFLAYILIGYVAI